MGKVLLDVLNGRRAEHVPLWLMRQAGRYLPEYRQVRAGARDFLAMCYTPSLATEVTLQPLRRFDLDAAIIFADILLVPDALGQAVRFSEGTGPALDRLEGSADLARLSMARLSRHLAPVYETIGRVKTALPRDVALIGFAGAPWTVATYMAEGHGSADQREARLWAFRDPQGFARLVDLLVEATVAHLSAQVAAGADVVQLFDTWAGSLDAEGFRTWCIAPTQRIVARLKEHHPGLPVIGFPRGAGARLIDYVTETGVDAVSLDSGVPRIWARDVLQPKVALQGNLDPLALCAGGPAMTSAVGDICSAWRGGRFIFNLGHGIVPETPPEHVAELVRLVREATR